VNRPVPELQIAEDNDVVEVKPGNVRERRAQSLTAMITNQQDAPTCPNCGNVVVRNGACYKCLNCGESLGCS
jgi:ribosomal protein L32